MSHTVAMETNEWVEIRYISLDTNSNQSIRIIVVESWHISLEMHVLQRVRGFFRYFHSFFFLLFFVFIIVHLSPY